MENEVPKIELSAEEFIGSILTDIAFGIYQTISTFRKFGKGEN